MKQPELKAYSNWDQEKFDPSKIDWKPFAEFLFKKVREMREEERKNNEHNSGSNN